MSSSLTRAARLVYLMRLLAERPRTTEELAELAGVSRRTVQKDLAELQAAPLYVPLRQEARWIYGTDEPAGRKEGPTRAPGAHDPYRPGR